eukprot:PhM_4_TR9417/c2_g1_i1/m.12583
MGATESVSVKNKSEGVPAATTTTAVVTNKTSNTNTNNTIHTILAEDYGNIDAAASNRLPQFVYKEIERGIKNETQRTCYELEKVMAKCTQDKFWTMWKCQRDRDAYFKCLKDSERAMQTTHMNELRWKYALGVFGGEIAGRRKFMNKLWEEYFPEKEIPHGWATDET